VALDSINSRFNVVNMPISTTAPIDAKTHVWPIDGIRHVIIHSRTHPSFSIIAHTICLGDTKLEL
jgi:hypothetical protein